MVFCEKGRKEGFRCSPESAGGAGSSGGSSSAARLQSGGDRDLSFLRSEKSLLILTGATGHLGNTTARLLSGGKAELRCLIFEKDCPNFLRDLPARFYQGDVRCPEDIDALFEDAAGRDIYFFHLASKISIEDKFDPSLYEINVGGTMNVLAACKKYGAKRLIYVSSVHAIPEPEEKRARIDELKKASDFSMEKVVGDYARSKALATRLVLEANRDGVETVVLQPSGLIGPNDYLFGYTTALFRRFLCKKMRQSVRGGYDFADVRDVAKAVVSAAERGTPGESYILTNQYFEIRELLNTLAELSGLRKIRHDLPIGVAKFFCPFLGWISRLKKERPLYTKYSLYTLRAAASFSHEKASRELLYMPRPIRETLADTIRFLGEQTQGRRRPRRPKKHKNACRPAKQRRRK